MDRIWRAASRAAIAAWLVPAVLLGCGKSGQRTGGGGTASATAPAALSDKEVEQAIAELGSPDKRAAAGEALAAIGPSAVEPLMVALLLRNPSQALKGEAIDVLTRMGHPAAEPMAKRLTEALDFASPADIAAIVNVLGKIGKRGDPNTAAALERASKHCAPEVTAAAKTALEKLK